MRSRKSKTAKLDEAQPSSRLSTVSAFLRTVKAQPLWGDWGDGPTAPFDCCRRLDAVSTCVAISIANATALALKVQGSSSATTSISQRFHFASVQNAVELAGQTRSRSAEKAIAQP
jgi:hypothetical protein